MKVRDAQVTRVAVVLSVFCRRESGATAYCVKWKSSRCHFMSVHAGFGVFQFVDGSKYEGNWLAGKYAGYGFLQARHFSV